MIYRSPVFDTKLKVGHEGLLWRSTIIQAVDKQEVKFE